MKAKTMKAANRSVSLPRLNTIPMSNYERWRANEGLRQGELVAEFVIGAVADLRAVAHGIEHAAASVASGIRAIFAKPVKH